MGAFIKGRLNFGLYALIVAALLFPKVALANTSVAILTNGKEIIVAADSKVTNGVTGKQMASSCKIHEMNGIVWAASGTIKDDASGLDVVPLIQQAIARGHGIVEIAKYLGPAAGHQVQAFVNYNVQHRRKIPGLAGQPLAVAFVGFEFGESVAAIDLFVTSDSDGTGQLQAQTRLFNGDQCPKGCQLMIGYDREALAYLNSNPNWASHMLTTARKLIRLEIAEHSDYVGAPVTLLRITPSGQKWIDSPTCTPAKKIEGH